MASVRSALPLAPFDLRGRIRSNNGLQARKIWQWGVPIVLVAMAPQLWPAWHSVNRNGPVPFASS